MLKISIEQFRCWESLHLKLPLRQTTLIKGNSGSGKTTILQAIIWCLYGNVKCVTPSHLSKANTNVIMKLPIIINGSIVDLMISRRTGKGRLLLHYNKLTYEDKVAQTIINNLFGIYDIWAASCNVEQRCRNSFLSIPNTSKLEFLNSLAFHEDNPEPYIQQINNNTSEISKIYNERLQVFMANLSNLELMLKYIDITKLLPIEQYNEILEQVRLKTLEKEQLILLNSKRDVAINILSSLNNQLRSIKDVVELNIDPDLSIFLTNHALDIDEASIKTLHSISISLQEKESLDSQINSTNGQIPKNFVDNSVKYTKEDYKEALSKEITIEENIKLSNYCNVSYDRDSIQKQITYLQDLLDSQERLVLEKQKQDLLLSIKSLEKEEYTPIEILPLEIPAPDYSKYCTNSLQEEYQSLIHQKRETEVNLNNLHKTLDILECPECSTTLRHQQGKLIKASEQPSNLEEINLVSMKLRHLDEQIICITNNIQSLVSAETKAREQYIQMTKVEEQRLTALKQKKQQQEFLEQNRKQTYSSQLLLLKQIEDKLASLKQTINQNILDVRNISNIHLILAKLKNIKILDPPLVSSIKIQAWLNHQAISEQLSLLSQKRSECIDKIPKIFINETSDNLRYFTDKLSRYINDSKRISYEKSHIDKMRSSLQEQILNLSKEIIDDPRVAITDITKYIADLQQKLEYSTKASQVVEYRKQLVLEREALEILNKKLMTSRLLAECALEAECHTLQEVVNRINKKIENVCNSLFEKDIDMKLSLFKTLKTTGNTKPMVNFSISYHGATFDNISQLSGGEGDRASFALTCALNKLSKCPLLMLDESFASLDNNSKLLAVKSINSKDGRPIKEGKKKTCIVIMHDGIDGIFDNCIDLNSGIGIRY